jgi:hypothetical protein
MAGDAVLHRRRARRARADRGRNPARRPSGPVPDEVWDEATRHYDEAQLAALVLSIAAINTWNRINVATRQITGEWAEQVVSREPADRAA